MKKKVKFDTEINGKKFKIVRPKKDTHIMAMPLENFPASGLHIIYNEKHIFRNHYDIFQDVGVKDDTDEPIYLYGYDSTPSFYIKSGQNTIKVDISDEDDIKFLPLTPTDKVETTFDIDEFNISSSATCWGIIIYDKEKVDGENLENNLLTRKRLKEQEEEKKNDV